MIRKVLLGVALSGLITVLGIGAVNRSNAKVHTGNGGGHGVRYSQEAAAGGGARTQGSGRPAMGQGGGTGQGTGASRGTGQESGNAQANVTAWQTLSGVVEQVDSDAFVLRTADGQSLTIDGRAWRFAREQGFTLRVGEQVTVRGFDDAGDLEAGRLTNTSTGQELQLREEAGRPLWAGAAS